MGIVASQINRLFRAYRIVLGERKIVLSMASTLESLPDDLVLKILVENLSAEDIHDSARLVCRKWYQMTKTPSFAYSHLQHNTDYALLFMKVFEHDTSISMSVRHDGRVETSELRNTLGGGSYVCGCNGLLLRCSNCVTLNVVNPVTKQDFLLPRIDGIYIWNCSLSYAAASMVYKVVAHYLKQAPDSTTVIHCWSILTVGVDNSWRQYCDTRFSYKAKAPITQKPLVTDGGFLHWCNVFLDNKVLTMDVETEIIRETHPPHFPQMYKKRRVFLSTGKFLTLLVCCGEYLWEVWEMKPQTGEWRKVAMLSLEACKGMLERIDFIKNQHLAPIGWLVYPDVLVFGVAKRKKHWVFSYNLVTQEMVSIRVRGEILNFTRFAHRSSLVWV